MSDVLPERTRRIKHDIDVLCKEGHRATASPEEARAADYMQEHLATLGCEVVRQRFRTPKTFGGLVLIHAAVGLLAAAIIPCCSFWAAILLGIATYSFFGEATGRWHLLRRFLPAGISQNVIGRYRPENVKRTVIFAGHLDSAQAGIIFHPRLTGQAGGRLTSVGPLFPTFAALLLLLLVAVISAFGGTGSILAILDWIGVLVLIGTSVLMIQWMRAEPVPGANDNASGIAATLEMARTLLADKPDGTEFLFVGFGAEESNLTGSIEFVREFGHQFDKETTFVINFDGIAAGAPHLVTEEMLMVPQAYPDQELIVLARSLSRSPDSPVVLAPARIQGHTDALPFAQAGFKAISLVGLEENGIPINYHSQGDNPERMPYDHTERILAFSDSLVAALRA